MIRALKNSLDRKFRLRHRLAAPAVVVGLMTGFVAVSFHLALDLGEGLREVVFHAARAQAGWGPWIILFWVLTSLLIAAGLVLRFAPEASGSGIPHLKAVISGHRSLRWVRVLVAKFVSTVVGISGGLLLGREGPSVQMGGAVGQATYALWPRNLSENRTALVAAGGGAGLAAAFNAPLASLIFTLEELEWRCGSTEFFTAAVACLVADMTCRLFFGQVPVFSVEAPGVAPLGWLVMFVPLGVLAGLLGGLFNHALLSTQRLCSLSPGPRFLWWVLLASLVSGTAWFFPELLGSGHHITEILLAGEELTLGSIALFFLIRFVLTIGSASACVAGGIFLPCLVLGGLLGLFAGEVTERLFPLIEGDSRLFVVVGMATFFTAVVRAPLTGMVLIIEMTGNYSLIMPLFVGCYTALMVADGVGFPPIYDAMLEQLLGHDRKR